MTSCSALSGTCRFLQRAIEHRQSLTGRAANDGVRMGRIALLEAQREKLVRQNLIESSQVVLIEVLRARLSTAIVAARAQLLNLPGRIAPQLEGESRPVIKEKLRVEV
jgi:signal transduction protein with GAF and PtsI domain